MSKVQSVQNAGALACVVCNNAPAAPFAMSGASVGITIPSVMISQADCDLLKAQLASGVNVSLSNLGPPVSLDGDLDNGIIAHEYGHGISNRLTGGPANVNCLNNAEQMGEGWSDYFGLMMTMKATDVRTTRRGIGTYVIGQATTGTGIRPAPYTTDMAVNGFTYADITNTTTITQPHGIGFLWCNALWEMTWNLIDDYGFDADLMNGTGGNNMAMQLVMEAMRLQPCSPGFVTGRNAILAADVSLFGGTNACQIWNAFAKRGVGFSASQGSSNNRLDGVVAFDIPPTVCSTLPVSWLDLSATPLTQTIRVDWNIASEQENKGFDVERREEGMAFQSLGFVPGNNTHAVQTAYSFEDKTALPGITYTYRLRQTDLDGSVHFSSLVEATLDPKNSLQVTLYPNPVSDLLTVSLSNQPGSPLEVQVFDLVGHLVKTNTFPAETLNCTLDMSELAAGVYLLKLQAGNLQGFHRIVVE